MLQLHPALHQCGECWLCTDQIQAALASECGAKNSNGRPLCSGSADVTDFQGLEMTFSSRTAGKRVDDAKTTAPHRSEVSMCRTSDRVERRPVSEGVLQGNGLSLHRNLYLCQ